MLTVVTSSDVLCGTIIRQQHYSDQRRRSLWFLFAPELREKNWQINGIRDVREKWELSEQAVWWRRAEQTNCCRWMITDLKKKKTWFRALAVHFKVLLLDYGYGFLGRSFRGNYSQFITLTLFSLHWHLTCLFAIFKTPRPVLWCRGFRFVYECVRVVVHAK